LFIRSKKSYIIDSKTGNTSSYYNSNPLYTISELIPDGAKILDVGSGNGALSRRLKEKRSDFIIDGIELNAYAAELSRQYYRRFYIGDARDYLDEINKEGYDYIVLADVIEHLSDPLEFLKDLYSCLTTKSRIIISLPNIAFGAIRFSLLNGNFDYVDSGILERTHLRFFTLKTLKSLIKNSDLNLEKIFYLQRSLIESEIPLEKLKLSPFLFYNINKSPLAYTYQFVVTLGKKPCITESIFVGATGKFSYFKYFARRHKNWILIKILTFLYRLYKNLR